MHPKTYLISLPKPFASFAPKAYVMHIHADSPFDAMDWVTRVFEGADVVDSRKGVVSVTDCDLFTQVLANSAVAAGKEPPAGSFRRGAAQIAKELLNIVLQLQDERARQVLAFANNKGNFECVGGDQYWALMEAAKAGAERALLWQTNVWAEYLLAQRSVEFSMPERVALV